MATQAWSAAKSHKEPFERTPLPDWPHKELLYETVDNGKIAIMTINRPERMNSSDPGMGARWFDAWTHFAADDNCWAAIVTGAGDRAFSAGQDLKIRRRAGEGGWRGTGAGRDSSDSLSGATPG